MQIHIRAKGFELTDALRAHVEHRLASAVDHVAHAITGAHVTLEDVNGPKGGVDKHCRVTFDGAPGGHEPIDATATDMYAAIDLATEKAGRWLTHDRKQRHPAHPDKQLRDTIRHPGKPGDAAT